MDYRTFGYFQPFFGFKVETDVGINRCFAPFGFSGCTAWIWPLVLISDGSGGANLLLWLLLKTWKKRQCGMVLFDMLQYQHQAAYFAFHVLKVQIRCNSIHYFQIRFDWGFQWTVGYQFICSAILWIHCWDCWGWWKFCSSMAFRDTLLGTVGLAGLGTDLIVLFFFCDFFWGLGMLKRSETIVLWRHWFGCSLLPEKPLNSPRLRGGRHDGAEGAISTKQYACLHWTVNEAICLSVN